MEKTRQLGEQLLRGAKRKQDPVLFLSAYQLIGTALWFMGNFVIAQQKFEQGFSYYDFHQHRAYTRLTDEDQGVVCLSYMAWNLWLLGFPERSLKRCNEALTFAQKLSHPLSTVFAQSYAAILHIFRQEPLKVQEHAEIAIALANEHGFEFFKAFAEIFLGFGQSLMGQNEEGS